MVQMNLPYLSNSLLSSLSGKMEKLVCPLGPFSFYPPQTKNLRVFCPALPLLLTANSKDEFASSFLKASPSAYASASRHTAWALPLAPLASDMAQAILGGVGGLSSLLPSDGPGAKRQERGVADRRESRPVVFFLPFFLPSDGPGAKRQERGVADRRESRPVVFFLPSFLQENVGSVASTIFGNTRKQLAPLGVCCFLATTWEPEGYLPSLGGGKTPLNTLCCPLFPSASPEEPLAQRCAPPPSPLPHLPTRPKFCTAEFGARMHTLFAILISGELRIANHV